MNTTMLLAQIWAPVLLAVGLGIFVSRKYYTRVYHDLQKETLAVLTFGMTAIAAAVIQIQMHNAWSTLPQIVISVLGWSLLLKGAALAIVPKLVDRGGDWTADSKLIPFVGAITLAVGAYLGWVGYLA